MKFLENGSRPQPPTSHRRVVAMSQSELQFDRVSCNIKSELSRVSYNLPRVICNLTEWSIWQSEWQFDRVSGNLTEWVAIWQSKLQFDRVSCNLKEWVAIWQSDLQITQWVAMSQSELQGHRVSCRVIEWGSSVRNYNGVPQTEVQ